VVQRLLRDQRGLHHDAAAAHIVALHPPARLHLVLGAHVAGQRRKLHLGRVLFVLRARPEQGAALLAGLVLFILVCCRRNAHAAPELLFVLAISTDGGAGLGLVLG
jgi:hypothetical protein